ncbi:unnamed protein product [Parnassius apollo]|uniref:(apollo) hypothetical protein n=1 Tax=Parnassius apollo TaxID=110799 RepID=A0A8S3XRM2_PARAO|nr:unnamed protein product [Parnassius apollo]
MFTPHKNSYLQLVCAVNPRVINKAVDQAMQVKQFDPHTELPAAQRLESMQPSLYAPHVDITRARLGFGRIGLRLIVRDLHSPDQLVQLQALHSVLDQVQISESAMHLIDLHVVFRLTDLMMASNPIIREKVCIIISHLANFHQGRRHIMSRPKIISNLMELLITECKEIRYAAAYTLKTLSRYLCCCEIISDEQIVENLLRIIKNDHSGIVRLIVHTLISLTQWDPVPALKANAFQVMLALFDNKDHRIVSAAMECMSQLCGHDVGRELADIHDVTFILKPFLMSESIKVKISAVGLMQYTTLTTRSKWRAKEICPELTKCLIRLCQYTNSPVLQLRSIQVLINLCDCPDIRHHMKAHWENKVKRIVICSARQWDGSDEITSYGNEIGFNLKTMCVEDVRTVKSDFGETANVVNLNSYLKRVCDAKDQLICAINWKPYD